jgi:hypothetical protein
LIGGLRMADLNNLSKIKYIYRIYESEDEVLHCEKYPVVYINSKVVYFKDARKQEYLNYVRLSNVLDNFTQFYQNNYYLSHYRPCFNRYFFNMETNIEEIYADLKKQREIIRCKDAEQKKIDRYEKAKREYEAALKEIEVMERIKESLNNEK